MSPKNNDLLDVVELTESKLELEISLTYRWNNLQSSGTYAIVHPSSRSVYIGSATNLAARLSVHKSSLKKGYHYVKSLQRLYDAVPEIKILAKLTLNKYEADQLEQELVSQLFGKTGLLNVGMNTAVPRTGMRDSAESRRANSVRNQAAFQTLEARIEHSKRIRRAKQGDVADAKKDVASRLVKSEARRQRLLAVDYAPAQQTVQVVADGVIYKSAAQAAAAMGISPEGVNRHLKRSLEGKVSRVRYLDEGRYTKLPK